eukprot:Gb_08926 [translate_table: standard]
MEDHYLSTAFASRQPLRLNYGHNSGTFFFYLPLFHLFVKLHQILLVFCFVWHNVIEGCKVNIKFREGNLKSIVDPLLADDFLPEDFKTVTELALKCAAFERSERPSMKDVLFILEPLLKKTICSNEKNTDLGMFADTISASSSPPPGEHSMSVEAFIAEESPVISRNTSMH